MRRDLQEGKACPAPAIIMNNNIVKRIWFYIIVGTYSIFHFFLTFVVTLFILSTLNIVNQRMFHLDKLDYIEIAVTAAIFFISIMVFIRSFNKISDFIRDTFFRDSF